jgi:Ca-activated chloride channel family protein
LAELTRTGFSPVSVRTGEAIQLAMQQLWLDGQVLPFGARLRVRHRFRSAEARPLEVIYAFALPRDAALRRFRVVGDGFAVRSELRKAEEARRSYEEALENGHLATLAQQYGDGLVNLTLGNLRPGETVAVYLEILAGVESHDKGFRFRFPFTLAPGYHARARVAAGGEIELPEEEFGDLILPQWREDADGLHEVGFDLRVSMPCAIREIGSPSHAVRVTNEGEGRGRVQAAAETNVPDRDLILDVNAAVRLSGVFSGVDERGQGRFVALIPSEQFGETKGSVRRVVFVLDRSGSMAGVTIAQARRAIEACLGAFSAEDEFGIVAFDNAVESFGEKLVKATRDNRDAARDFLKGIDARGGTELAAGVLEGARMLGERGGDILLATDGQVFGTEAIQGRIRGLGIRVHCLGIGAASQDRFLSLLARQTGGVSRFLSPSERVDLPALELFGGIGRPVATEVNLRVEAPGGEVAVEPAKSVFASTPLVVFGVAAASGDARLEVGWKGGGCLEIPFTIGESKLGEVVRLLTGARMLTDLESQGTGEGRLGAVERRQAERIERRLEALSLEYGLASRVMALVAVVERVEDRPGVLPETRVVPVGTPFGVQFESYFRPRAAAARLAAGPPHALAASRPRQRQVVAFSDSRAAEDELVELAAMIEPDGGMPGVNAEARVLATLLALLRFLGEGHTLASGAFRFHVQRLVEFLEANMDSLAGDRRASVQAAVELARAGESLPGEWRLPRTPGAGEWKRIRKALAAAGRL